MEFLNQVQYDLYYSMSMNQTDLLIAVGMLVFLAVWAFSLFSER